MVATAKVCTRLPTPGAAWIHQSNRRRGWRLHHHGGFVCLVICAFCVLSDL